MVDQVPFSYPAPCWIDTHAHLDAPGVLLAQTTDSIEISAREPGSHRIALESLHGPKKKLIFVQDPALHGVPLGVIPAVEAANFSAVQAIAHGLRWSYGLGIHPMYTPQAAEEDLGVLQSVLQAACADPYLVAVGEIGLDLFVPNLRHPSALAKQEHFYRAQLKLARKFDLPVILHVRRSADLLLKHLRQIHVRGGIAHAFNGSFAQAHALIERGFKLGFGGAMTYPQATQLRALATTLPLEAIVLETDSPDIPPQWLYRTAQQRASGQPQSINTPSELPRIGEVLAQLRGISIEEVRSATSRNAIDALPRLQRLL